MRWIPSITAFDEDRRSMIARARSLSSNHTVGIIILSPLLPREIFPLFFLFSSPSLLSNATLSMLFSRGTRIDLVDRFFHRYLVLASLTDEGGREYCSLFPSSTRKKNPTRARLAQDNPTCCQESSHSIRAKISESSNRSFEPHPTVTVRRTLRYRYRQTLYLIRTHDSGKGTRRRGEAVIRSVLQRNTTITRWPVSLSLSLFSRERRTEPRRFQEAKKSRALNFPSSLAKKKFERAVRGLSRGPKGARWTYSAKRVIKPETTREKVGFRIRAGWWSSSLCLRAQAELRPSYSVSFPPHLLLSSTVIPRPSSDPASRSLGEFLSLSVARLARWRQPRAMASNLSRNFRI